MDNEEENNVHMSQDIKCSIKSLNQHTEEKTILNDDDIAKTITFHQEKHLSALTTIHDEIMDVTVRQEEKVTEFLSDGTDKYLIHESSVLKTSSSPTSMQEVKCNANLVEKVEAINMEDKDIEMNGDRSCHFYYNWNSTPKLLCTAVKEYQPTALYENFTKGCQWSPDGTCLLVPSEDFRIRVYELPKELYSGLLTTQLTSNSMSAALTVKEGGLVYDSCWYPFMNSWDPATCCFLSASRESPVHLWDAFTGELRATYRAYNQVDEVEASISAQFVDSGKAVWCGFKNVIRIFDTDRPGRQIKTIDFKKDFPNVKGLVSCIRENPIMPGLIAFGTYSNCIGLYKDTPVCVFKMESGLTQIEFSPCGTKIFSSVRRSGEFLCWDLRNPGVVLYSFQNRSSDTNQRIQFSITPNGEQIVSGSVDGKITIWEMPESTMDYNFVHPKYKIQLSSDCINGVALHRNLPVLATSSGQRLYDKQTECRDNSVRLWQIY